MDSRYKFRGWDTRKNVMYSAEKMGKDQLTLSVDGRGFINVSGVSTKRSTFPTHIIPLQYTGLKDKDGKEIYEGDIVGLCYGIPPTVDTLLIEYADNEIVADISVSGWWMRNIRSNGVSACLCKTYENDLKIIGNVQENSELLTEKSHA